MIARRLRTELCIGQNDLRDHPILEAWDLDTLESDRSNGLRTLFHGEDLQTARE